MFIEQIKNLIANNPNIVSITNRGLEDKYRNVIFIAKDLDKRYPELVKWFYKKDIPDIKINTKKKIKASK